MIAEVLKTGDAVNERLMEADVVTEQGDCVNPWFFRAGAEASANASASARGGGSGGGGGGGTGRRSLQAQKQLGVAAMLFAVGGGGGFGARSQLARRSSRRSRPTREP